MSSPPPPAQRLRLHYAKTGDVRFVGHLDEARFWERVFRRVGLPLAYSHGFNPQARLQFAAALPVGVEGQDELLDLWLTERVEPKDWRQRIQGSLPPGFTLDAIAEVPLGLPAMQSVIQAAVYEVRWEREIDAEELARRVQTLLAASDLPRQHHKDREKTYDLRPLILALVVVPPTSTLQMRLQAQARAAEVVAVLGMDDWPHRLCRTQVLLAEPLQL